MVNPHLQSLTHPLTRVGLTSLLRHRTITPDEVIETYEKLVFISTL